MHTQGVTKTEFYEDDEPVADVIAAYQGGRDFITEKAQGIAFTAQGVRFNHNRVARVLEVSDLQAPKPART